jgi:hypothetical protein
MSRCPVPHKASYWTETEALDNTHDGVLEPYSCTCGRWHNRTVTKQRSYQRARTTRLNRYTEETIRQAATTNGTSWPPDAIQDFIAGMGVRTIARKYGRTYEAAANKRRALKSKGVIA